MGVKKIFNFWIREFGEMLLKKVFFFIMLIFDIIIFELKVKLKMVILNWKLNILRYDLLIFGKCWLVFLFLNWEKICYLK